MCDPSISRIVSVTLLLELKITLIRSNALKKILHLYKNVDFLIHDLACKLVPAALNKMNEKMIK